ncbi:uncharacterized protein [Bombus fervidus]|uniref:uncharacterized protein n=1 Tax=Bombus fervidus TaxID=203811 RepID=UPI003D18F310
MAEKSGETAHLAAIERKVEELCPSLIQMMEERLENIERRREKEVVSDMTTRRVEPGVPNTPAIKEEQGAAMEWQTVERRNRKKKEQGGETTGEDNSRGRSEEPKESPGVRVGERAKRGRQAASPTHTANIGGDHHTEGQVGQILREGVSRGQG